MKKLQQNAAKTCMILFMLAVSPISITYSYADLETNQDGIKISTIRSQKSVENVKLGEILTEKVVDGKLLLHRYALPSDIAHEDVKKMISFGWGLFGCTYSENKTYQAGIILFDSKTSKSENNFENITKNETSNAKIGNFILKINEKLGNSDSTMPEISSDKEFDYKVIFSEKNEKMKMCDRLFIFLSILT